jgi:hypothetical protein
MNIQNPKLMPSIAIGGQVTTPIRFSINITTKVNFFLNLHKILDSGNLPRYVNYVLSQRKFSNRAEWSWTLALRGPQMIYFLRVSAAKSLHRKPSCQSRTRTSKLKDAA